MTSAIECVDNALDSLWIRLRSVGLEWSQWLKDHFDFYSFDHAAWRHDDHFGSHRLSVRDRAICGSERQVFAQRRGGLQASPGAFGSHWSPCAAAGKVVAASLTKDVVAQAKRSFISTFKNFEGLRRKLLLTFLACNARSRLQTRCLSAKNRLGSRMRAGALGAF